MKLSKQDNGREITIGVGNIIEIQLERSGGTGYEWYLDNSYNECLERVSESTEALSGEGRVGAPVMRTWKLKAVKKGVTVVSLRLYRVWEGKEKAVDFFTIRVKIL